jgi:hypothetical protein
MRHHVVGIKVLAEFGVRGELCVADREISVRGIDTQAILPAEAVRVVENGSRCLARILSLGIGPLLESRHSGPMSKGRRVASRRGVVIG